MVQVNILILLYLLVFQQVSLGKQCIENFYELRDSLLTRDSNIENMREAFFPANRQASSALDVMYYFRDENATSNTSLELLETESPAYRFQWATVQVLILLRPSVLQGLSLHLFYPLTETVRLVVDPICYHPTDGSNRQLFCNETDYLETDRGLSVRLLNRLTVRLNSYAVNGDKDIVDDAVIGFSSYFFNNEDSDDSCVIGLSDFYAYNYVLLSISMVCLTLLMIISAPIGIIYIYEKYSSAKQEFVNGNGKYLFWAAAVVSAFLVAIILIVDTSTVIQRTFEVEGSIIIFYWGTCAVILLSPILQLIVTFLVVWILGRHKYVAFDRFLLPKLFCCGNKKHMNVAAICIFGVITLAAAVHAVFIVLALNVSTIQVFSILAFCIAAVLCVTSYIALFFKVFDATEKVKAHHVLQGITSIVVGTLFVGFVLSFVIFFVAVTILAGESSTGEFGSGVIGELLPTAVLALLTFLAQKLLTVSDAPTTSQEEENAGMNATP